MNPLLKKFGAALLEIVTSKKFLTGAVTMVVQAMPMSAEMKQHAIEIGIALIVGQGLADLGKSKAKVEAAAGK